MCVFLERGWHPGRTCVYFLRNKLPGSPCAAWSGVAELRTFGADLPYIVEELVFRMARAQPSPATAVYTAVFHSLCFSRAWFDTPVGQA